MVKQSHAIGRNGHASETGPSYVLGRYQEFSVGAFMAPYVQCAWRYTPPPNAPVTPPHSHLVLPDPGVDLTFSCRRDALGGCLDATLEFQGSVHQPRAFHPTGDFEIVAVKFYPDAAIPILGIRAGEHLDAIEPLTNFDVRLGRDLLSEMGETRSWSRALALLLNVIRDRVVQNDGSTTQAQAYAAAVRAAPSSNPVEWAADQLSISARQIRRVFGRELGISPKRFTRILRLLKTVRAADAAPRPRWAHLAYEFGYSDQAHLINEARALVGLTPASLHRARRAQTER
jgi:AraC-like DNA-binding protein